MISIASILSLRFIIHYSLHFIFPALVAFVFYRATWFRVWILFLTTMLVDLDHLLATPIYDPNRCSIGFHLLHSYPAIVCYIILLFPVRTRIIAIGLLMHMMTDTLDAYWALH